MERLAVLLLLGLTLLGISSLSARAGELDFLDEVDDTFENRVDIDIESLDFINPENRMGQAGKLLFRKFHIQNSKANIFLGNDEHVFDSDIFVKNSKIGIIGPHSRFSYKLDEINTNYLYSFKWVKVESTRLEMNPEFISLRGEYYEIRKPETQLKLGNFIWDCDRHQDYLENDSQGFLSGCLNFAEIKPLNDESPIEVGVSFFDEENQDLTLKASIDSVSLKEEKISGTSKLSTLTFPNGVHLASSRMELECYKPKDLIDINSENLLIPCLNDLSMSSELFGIEFIDDSLEYYNIKKPDLLIDREKIQLKTDLFVFESPDVKVKLDDAMVTARKFDHFDELDFDSYLKALYNASLFVPSKRTTPIKLDLVLIDEEATEKQTRKIKIQSRLNLLSADQSKIIIKAPQSKIAMDDKYDFFLNQALVECEKESNIIDFNMDKVFADCKHNGRYEMRDVLIDNKDDEKKSKYYLKPEFLEAKEGELSMLASGFQMVDAKENITLFNTSIRCKKDYEKDLFDILDVIEGCLESSQAYILRIVSEKNRKRDKTKNIYTIYQEMLRGRVFNPVSLIRTKDAFVRDVKISIKDNWLKVDLDIKFLKADLKVKAEGTITLDRENEKLIIDLQKTKLPLTKSKKVLMYFLKKNMATETINFVDGKIIINL